MSQLRGRLEFDVDWSDWVRAGEWLLSCPNAPEHPPLSIAFLNRGSDQAVKVDEDDLRQACHPGKA